MAWGELRADVQTLRPLTPSLHRGLLAITILASISFFASLALFSYLTYKLVVWQFFIRRRQGEALGRLQRNQGEHGEHDDERRWEEERNRQMSQQAIDFALGIDGVFSNHPGTFKAASIVETSRQLEQSPFSIRPTASSPNQFLILIYHLLMADLHQAIAFALNASWLYRDGIVVGTARCFTQGLFLSTGDLSSSMFITFIAIHTYLSVVRGYRPSQKTLYTGIALVWVFVYLISTIPIMATQYGAAVGGYYVRAGAWCWVNAEYEDIRLLTHYIWIFIAIGTTSVLYVAIWISLGRQARQRATKPNAAGAGPGEQANYNPAFLIYPVIYVMCTLPLATGRVATMAGAKVPLGFFCFAGALISCSGFLDCLLFGTTRYAIIFGSKYDIDAADTGVKTIAFLQTPRARRYGNIVWVQGGASGRRKPESKSAGGWWSWQRLAGQSDSRSDTTRPRGGSQESLRGPGIHMDMVTTVVVEVEGNKEIEPRYPDPIASASPSLNSTERRFSRDMCE